MKFNKRHLALFAVVVCFIWLFRNRHRHDHDDYYHHHHHHHNHHKDDHHNGGAWQASWKYNRSTDSFIVGCRARWDKHTVGFSVADALNPCTFPHKLHTQCRVSVGGKLSPRPLPQNPSSGKRNRDEPRSELEKLRDDGLVLVHRCPEHFFGGEWPYYTQVWADAVPLSKRTKCEEMVLMFYTQWLTFARNKVRNIFKMEGLLAAANEVNRLAGESLLSGGLVEHRRWDQTPNILHPMHHESAPERLIRGATNCDGVAVLLAHLVADVFPFAAYSSVDNHGHVFATVGNIRKKSSLWGDHHDHQGRSIKYDGTALHIDPHSYICPWTTSPSAPSGIPRFNRDKLMFSKVVTPRWWPDERRRQEMDGVVELGGIPDEHSGGNGEVSIDRHPNLFSYEEGRCNDEAAKQHHHDIPHHAPVSFLQEEMTVYPSSTQWEVYLRARIFHLTYVLEDVGDNNERKREVLAEWEKVRKETCERRHDHLGSFIKQDEFICRLASVFSRQLKNGYNC